MAKPDLKSDQFNPNNLQALQNMVNQIDSDKAKLRKLIVAAESHQALLKAIILEWKKK